ncbi:hypothetical protein DNTS_023657 [Danionella cerebrum]|uniref:Transcription factor ETV6 n=1 Tax=Danionella cerebrum TaxID=2873325 RepID=A0A553QYN3_9TELE|nr:hypothetical protein DNTS_023657 [Danionella translucida]
MSIASSQSPLRKGCNGKDPPVNFAMGDLSSDSSSICETSPDELCKLPGRLWINPSLWNKEDVNLWLRWAQREYSLRRTEHHRFEMNGKALCLLTKEDFRLRCPSSGDVLYELLQHVKQQRRSSIFSLPHSSQQMTETHQTTGLNVPWSRSVPVCPVNPNPWKDRVEGCPDQSQDRKPVMGNSEHPQGINRQPGDFHSSEEPLNLSSKAENSTEPSEATGKIPDCRLLWNYVYQLLSDTKYEAFIRWEDPVAMTFRVVDPNGLARLWGNHKNRANMTYEKMSRALRHYYKLNIIKKETGQRLLFRFLKSPEEIMLGRSERAEEPESPDSPGSQDYRDEGLEVSPFSVPASPISDSEHRFSISPIP